MAIDLGLAVLHHLLVFGLVAMLVAEAVLLRGPLTDDMVPRIAKIDGGYGLCAGLLLVVGLMRVFMGVKGEDFYLHNPYFHAKVGAFVLVGLLSIIPTVRFLRWRKTQHADPVFVPDPQRLGRLRTILRIELGLVAVIFALAAAMARYGGF